MVDYVLDKAGQKGTGKWTSQSALDLGVPVTGITEAVFARFLSALKDQRVAAAPQLAGPSGTYNGDKSAFVQAVRDALYASKVTLYGVALPREKVVASKAQALSKAPDYSQTIEQLNLSQEGGAPVLSFKKSWKANGKPGAVQGVLGFVKEGTSWVISMESDEATQGRLAKVAAAKGTDCESAVMSGGPAGEHGIMGIGDGFIPALMDMMRVHEVVRVSTEAAHDECRRLRETHGWCVGVSSGANMLAARAFARPDHTVVTLWPDSADRYASVGLGMVRPGSGGCPLAHRCERRRELISLG